MTRAASDALDCPVCGIPLDAEIFDVSRVEAPPAVGQTLVLARFDLPARYCGVLQRFQQFVGLADGPQPGVRTPGLEWSVRTDGRPLAPYTGFEFVLNAWGGDVFEVKIRLDEGARLEFVVRGVPPGPDPAVEYVGGRLAGRYWYNVLHGDVDRVKSAPWGAVRRA
ncbi:MAG TPA: hypothetical protein VD833_14800 [Vicinamibacterales bacterium]|nr:hypothetical protein [Vicinamibacterales bacterium]